jgi:AcrR family transcriptional regulator
MSGGVYPIYLAAKEGPARVLAGFRQVLDDLRAKDPSKAMDLRFDEGWIQELLCTHPEILPVHEFGPQAYADPVCAAREINAAGGYLDHLFLSFNAHLILTECKLYANREQLRAVLGQLLQYTADVSTWSVERLDEEIKRAAGRKSAVPGIGSLHDCVERLKKVAVRRGEDPEEYETRFHRALRRNLEEARFLLLVVGDQIRESLIEVAEMLNDPAHRVRGFTLGLVELGLYSIDPPNPWPIVAVPTVVERTKERERVTIRVQYDAAGSRPSVIVEKASLEDAKTAKVRASLADLQDFYSRMRDKGGQDSEEIARKLVEDLEQAGIQVDLGEAHLTGSHIDGEDRVFHLLRVRPAYRDVGFTGSNLMFKLIKVFGEERGRQISDACERHVAELKAKGLPIRKSAQNQYCDLKALESPEARRSVLSALHEVRNEIDKAVAGLGQKQ